MPKIIKTKSKLSKKERKPIITYIISALKGGLVCLIGLLFLAFAVMNNFKINLFFIILIYVFVSIGGLTAGFLSQRELKEKGMINGGIAGTIYSLSLIITISILLMFDINVKILLFLPLGIVFGIVGGIISANK